MNIYTIREEVQALEEIGLTIDTPERLRLQLALIRLSELANADQLLFWGKITTTSSPYYIAMAVDFKGHYAFPHKKFYYSKDNLVFAELPELDQFNRAQVDTFNTLPFTGNPQTVLITLPAEGEEKKQPKQEDGDSEQEETLKILPKNYTEEDRLAYTVLAIENQCQVVPVGAFRMIAAHEIRYNEQFNGVPRFGLTAFSHFRYPLSVEGKQKIESVEAVFEVDLLEPIENGSYWSAQTNTANTLGTVRSLLWPGYVGFAFLGRRFFGGVYFGNGLKQVQLQFFL